MTAFFGATPITGIKFGSTSIVKVMFGSVTLWSPGTRDDFDYEDQIGLPATWTRHGPSTSDTYQASIRDGYVRLNMPQSTGVLAAQRDEWRYGVSTLGADNGYIETQLAQPGTADATFRSRVFARVSNTTAAGTALPSGVGIGFAGKTALITRRVAGTTTDIKCGSCADGDIFRLTFNGNVHMLFRNNTDVGVWTDTGYTVPTAAGFRSMALSVMGGKYNVFTPRLYSAGLEYVEMGLLAA